MCGMKGNESSEEVLPAVPAEPPVDQTCLEKGHRDVSTWQSLLCGLRSNSGTSLPFGSLL